MPNVRIGSKIYDLIQSLDSSLPTPADTLEGWLNLEDAETPEDQAKLVFEYLVKAQKVMAHIVQSANDELEESKYE